ncbi:MAG: hypothetical protein LBD04_06710 [Synergistaceae bacterium]|nr:hypothetical protein [Synergistaceae bacterium]
MQRWKRSGPLFGVILAILILALMSTVGGCGGGSDDGGDGGDGFDTGTLTVRAFVPSYDENGEYHGINNSAPSGAIINVNGVECGLTGDDGTLTIRVPAGELEVDARRYPGEWGNDFVTLEPGGHAQVDIVMHEGKEMVENSTLVIDQLRNGVLDRDFDAMTLRFISNSGKPVILTEVAWVELLDPRGGADTSVGQLFTLRPDGTLILNDVAAFKKLLSKRSGKILLNVDGYDTDERTHDQTVEFYVGAYKVVGQLVVPPSNPGLSVAGIEISADLMDTGLMFNAVSDASGNFEFPLRLPAGHLDFTSLAVQNGEYYYGEGILIVNGNKLLTVNMRALTDIENGVPAFTAVPLPGSFSASDEISARARSDPEREQLHQLWTAEFLNEGIFAASADAPGSTTVSVRAISGKKDVDVEQSATLSVPKSTESVTLTYSVTTAEYPKYVLRQSIYNDTWGIIIKAEGT